MRKFVALGVATAVLAGCGSKSVSASEGPAPTPASSLALEACGMWTVEDHVPVSIAALPLGFLAVVHSADRATSGLDVLVGQSVIDPTRKVLGIAGVVPDGFGRYPALKLEADTAGFGKVSIVVNDTCLNDGYFPGPDGREYNIAHIPNLGAATSS